MELEGKKFLALPTSKQVPCEPLALVYFGVFLGTRERIPIFV